MNEPFITINDKKIEFGKGGYTKRNAELILLAGHVFHSLESRSEFLKGKLNISEEDRKTVLRELENAECWLFPAITALGELIAAANIDLLEDDTLINTGLLVSSLTELLYSAQRTRKLVTYCSTKDQEANEAIEKVENQ